MRFTILLLLFICREMKMELDDQGFCSSLPLNVDTFTTPLRGSLHLVRDTSAEKEFDIAM